MEFLLGCNWWASNAGADMWRNFDEKAIEKDMAALEKYGVTHIRAFPNWRDFQPIIPLMKSGGLVADYCLENDEKSENEYYIPEVMLKRFAMFLDICKKHNIRVIVGLITGWMSGRLYVPPILFQKNVITDPLAQYFEQLFIKGFVSRVKYHESIIAWDLGNECNCMGNADRIGAANWTAMISNAIRAEDNERPIFSGMDGLFLDRTKAWQVKDLAMFTDILTTHPYPYWCIHTNNDKILSFRTTMHATAQTKLYGEVGGKPCMAEEIGTMGPMLCSNENAAKFLRVNLFSLWANGSCGVMWWCANEQTMLSKFPYAENTCELELGMLDENHNPKPVLLEMKKFSDFLKKKKFNLPKPEVDAVCILSHEQDQWGVGYMTHNLIKQAGLNLKFAFSDGEIPQSDLYLLPSVNGKIIMDKTKFENLKTRVYEGADLYISADNVIIAEFEKLCGMKVLDSYEYAQENKLILDGEEIEFTRRRVFCLEEAGACVLAYDNDQNPAIVVNRYGNGRVFYVNFPLESSLINKHNVFEKNGYLIYRKLFKDYIDRKKVKISAEDVAVTYHNEGDVIYAVLVNHSDSKKEIDITLSDGFELDKVYYGSEKSVNAFDASILEFKKA